MKINKIILVIFFCVFLYGCYDNVELEERGLALAIGIDKYDNKNKSDITENTKNNNFTVSISMPNISEGEEEKASKGETDNENKEKVTVNKNIKLADASTISSATNLIDTYMSKKLYYGHTKVVVLGEEILSDEKLLRESIDFLERNKEMSRKLIILGTNGSASDILKIMPKDEKMIGIYINEFYKNNKENVSTTLRLSLDELVSNLLITGDSIIPSIEILNNDVLLKGLLVIKDYELISYLDEELTKGFLWLMDKKPYGDISIPFEGKNISISINRSKLKKDIYEKNGKINYDVNINLWGSVSEYIFDEKVIMDSEKYKIVEKNISNYIKKEILNTINKTIQLDIDILNIKDKIRRYEYGLYKKYGLENSDMYDKIKLNININTTIKNANTLK